MNSCLFFSPILILLQGDQDSFVEKVTEICDERLKIGFSKLCARIKPKDKENIDKEDMRKLLFCDFCDTKNDEKFYKEVTDINKFRQIAEDLLVKYNEVSRKPMDLTLFDFAMEHLCRISRVLKVSILLGSQSESEFFLFFIFKYKNVHLISRIFLNSSNRKVIP